MRFCVAAVPITSTHMCVTCKSSQDSKFDYFRLIAMTARRTKARKRFLKQRLHASTVARMLAKPSKSLEKNKINLDWASACGFIALFNQDREHACVLRISSDEEAQNTYFDLLMLCCRHGRKETSFRRSCGRSSTKRTCCVQTQRCQDSAFHVGLARGCACYSSAVTRRR